MTEIPLNATIRQEYVKCGNPDCQNLHGPYLYAYWKHDKKLNKTYVVIRCSLDVIYVCDCCLCSMLSHRYVVDYSCISPSFFYIVDPF